MSLGEKEEEFMLTSLGIFSEWGCVCRDLMEGAASGFVPLAMELTYGKFLSREKP